MNDKIRVLFVCLGNICRSPLAEGVFAGLVRERGLDNRIACDSAGTSGWHIGDRPDPRTIETAEKHGLRLDHLGRKFVSGDFQRFDYILAMDRQNYADIRSVPGYREYDPERLKLMRDYDDREPGGDVPDPYYGGMDGFEQVYGILHRSCGRLLDDIVRLNGL
jgi:protein-tyrosine phosphatase